YGLQVPSAHRTSSLRTPWARRSPVRNGGSSTTRTQQDRFPNPHVAYAGAQLFSGTSRLNEFTEFDPAAVTDAAWVSRPDRTARPRPLRPPVAGSTRASRPLPVCRIDRWTWIPQVGPSVPARGTSVPR